MNKYTKTRCCWVAKQYKKGWRLGMAFEDETTYLDRWFKSIKDIKKAMKLNMLFVHSNDGEELKLKKAS